MHVRYKSATSSTPHACHTRVTRMLHALKLLMKRVQTRVHVSLHTRGHVSVHTHVSRPSVTYRQELISAAKRRKGALDLRGFLVLTVVECRYALFTI